MIIPITLPSSSSSSSSSTSFSSLANPTLPPGLVKISNDEIMLIELQGSLEVESNDPTERNGKLVGKLKIDEATNKPTLLIGHHLLEGKIAALPKAYAILVRRTRTRGVGGEGGGGGGGGGGGEKGKGKGDTDVTTAANSDPARKTDRRRRRGTSQRSKNGAAAGTDHPDPDDVGLMDVDPISGNPPEESPDFYGEEDEQKDSEDEDEDGPGSDDSGAGTGAGWAIAGIVRKKIIFSKRPMPVTIKK